MNKKLTIGILAHVDAGKTTLSEALLFLSGRIRTLGRVDHGNTYLDTNEVERERGITIFSKQARFSYDNCDFILLDTPGHVDFSAETERTLALLDYAILVISAPDGVQNHTRTLWQLLEFYGIPTFIFVNKTDISVRPPEELEEHLCRSLSSSCVAFLPTYTKREQDEKLAMLDEEFLESFLSDIPISSSDIAELVSERRLYPCIFGAALKTEGVEDLLRVLSLYTLSPVYPEKEFGAKVYKIARSGADRITYIKLTSGMLTTRDELSYLSADGKKITEQVSRLRLYSGDKFQQVESVSAGEICAVLGLSATYVGQGLGCEDDTCKPILEPVLSYRILLPKECDPILYFPKLKELEEEEPSLHLYWNDELSQIEARLMGDIQIDLLKRMILDRFSVACELDAGRILYKEKAAGRAIGIGHFEPLRHYAEVQLLLEPQPKGTGLIFDTNLPENPLDTNWQRLILFNLYEKKHRGTLIGAELTDTKITLVAGKAHLKHTEGGDFREATLRAVRQGLMKCGCTLLEPYYKFRLELPDAHIGRALNDLQMRSAEFDIASSDGGYTVIRGRAPVSEIHDYPRELISYSRGQGTISFVSDGYEPCHNSPEIVAASGYDPESDLENTPHSVFCAHGAGFLVPWQEVDSYKHLETDIALNNATGAIIPNASSLGRRYSLSDAELEAIMLREFGPIKRRKYVEPKTISAGDETSKKPPRKKSRPTKKMLIVDGYNVIYSWQELKNVADYSLEKARDELLDVLSNYVAFTKTELIL
ncbi:MAG: NYN domain-containing protein, partial [Clostridia bacterium]|nr:NYN domain-containing protein [Clostridia bacterium]